MIRINLLPFRAARRRENVRRQTSIFFLSVVLVTIVPISIAGWGVREGAMVAAFAYAGLQQADGLIVSLLFGAGYLVLGVVGGLIWVLTSDRSKRPAATDTASVK